MRKTKMMKVYVPGWQLWMFSLTINLSVLAIQPYSSLAQAIAEPLNEQKIANNLENNSGVADLEPKILAEINRVRTNPQDYAQWLEEQRQYYDGIWLKLPGEKPVRTNRGKKALEEAISFLKEQQPLSPLATSEQTAANAISELDNFANANNIQYFSYGRKTAKGIVMDLVVDELFPDRRRRLNLLSPEAEDTGVVCKPDPRYAKVCAIAYSDSPNVDTPNNNDVAVAQPEPETSTTPNSEVEKLPDTPPSNIDTANSNPEPAPKPQASSAEDTNVATAALPTPPQPQIPPTPSPAVSNESQSSQQAEANSAEKQQIAQAELEIEAEQKKLTDEESEPEPEPEPEPEDNDTEESNVEQELDESEEFAEEKIEPEIDVDDESTESNESNQDDESEIVEEDTASEAEIEEEPFQPLEDDSDEVAINTENADIEKVERGALEDGDRIIADDGSLYDFYPLQGKEGESFTIYLESDEFDAFVALVDSNGNTIGENDDISQSDSNSKISVTLPADGVYNVIVNTYDQQGKGEYVLKVSR